MEKKIKKSILKKKLLYSSKENYLLMPNELMDIFINDTELNEKKAPHVAFAYTYLYFITWLYRYAKYGEMTFEDITKASIFEVIGVSKTSKEYDYIVKKDGVLDRLGLTSTLSYINAPIIWMINKEEGHGFPEFYYFYELEKEVKDKILEGQTTKRRQIKEPLLATGFRYPKNEDGCEEKYNGTFYDGGKEYTHMVGFDVFIKCMTEPKLGYVAFYLYAFLKARIGANTVVNISLEGITKYSGILPSTRDKYLKELKGFCLIGSLPEDFCIERGEYHTESSMYWIKDSDDWLIDPDYNFPKRKVYHVSTHTDYVKSSDIGTG
ncbi:hypothetical protein CEQ21_16070 [Niallia circulans]|uniref:Uncharacterized protein n=1 Tax=Niallia circulans TaxID=1397 RepID=A0A553SJ43_NIACI|nr:hypothetical protein [Niallia circulans]TRZ37010.1 hypothetical protein CEQ21_16070 [Niallia circulans]